MSIKKIVVLLLLGFVSVTGGASELPALAVEGVSLRAPLPGQTTAVVYFTLVNRSAETLILQGASAQWAKKLEIHEHQHSNGMMRMRQLPQLAVPVGESVAFESGSYHLMGFDFELEAFKKSPSLELHLKSGETIMVALPSL